MPQGPLGGPRPAAQSELTIKIESDHLSESEVDIELAVRERVMPRADVEVSPVEDFSFSMIYVHTRDEQLNMDTIHKVTRAVGDVVGETFNHKDIEIVAS